MAIEQKNISAEESTRVTIRSDRSFAQYALFSILTLSIYHYFFLDSWVRDINQICREDGEHTPGVGEMLLFSVLTLGIYKYLWIAHIVDRIYNNASRYGADVRQDGNDFFLWVILVPVVGCFIAMYFAIRDTNRLAAAYSSQKTAAKQRYRKSVNPKQQRSQPLEQGALVGLAGKLAGTKILLSPGQKIVIGRDPSAAAVVVESEKISRTHCIIQYNGKQIGYSITDKSQNGVWLNGQRIHYNLLTYAASGAVVALADGENKFQLL